MLIEQGTLLTSKLRFESEEETLLMSKLILSKVFKMPKNTKVESRQYPKFNFNKGQY